MNNYCNKECENRWVDRTFKKWENFFSCKTKLNDDIILTESKERWDLDFNICAYCKKDIDTVVYRDTKD